MDLSWFSLKQKSKQCLSFNGFTVIQRLTAHLAGSMRYCFQVSHFKNLTQVLNLFSTERGFFSTLVKKDPSEMKPCEDQA